MFGHSTESMTIHYIQLNGLTKGDIFNAIFTYRDRIIQAENDNNSYYTWGDGDSLDRERVRDIILEQPQFTWTN